MEHAVQKQIIDPRTRSVTAYCARPVALDPCLRPTHPAMLQAKPAGMGTSPSIGPAQFPRVWFLPLQHVEDVVQRLVHAVGGGEHTALELRD